MDLLLRVSPALKAHRWGTSLAVALGLGLVGYLSRATYLDIPFLQDVLPARVLVAVVAVVVAITPLYLTFPDLVDTLDRERAVRRVRPYGVVALALIAYLPAAVAVPDSVDDTRLFLAALTLGLLAVAAVGDLAWTVVFAAGFASLIVDTAPGAPVTSALAACTTLGLAVALAGATVLVGAVGPRRLRTLAD